MTALKTASDFVRLMELGAQGATHSAPAEMCENRSLGAQWVCDYLGGHTRYGSPVSLEDALKGARRAWGDDIPADVKAALVEKESE
jgi:hypothetical protein